jgi:glycosyltransferase involved in cell wall biosynthesis
MKLLFLGRGNNHPATRYRITQYLDYLKTAKIEFEVKDFPKGFFSWYALTKQQYEIVFLQKKRVQTFWLKRFKKLGAKIIYDFDDAVMFASSRHASPNSPVRMKQFINMVKDSDAVIAGNPYLKNQAELYNNRIWIIPTSIDISKYALKNYTLSPTRITTIGWIGGAKSLVFLKELLPVLEKLSERCRFQLKIVSDEFIKSDKIKIIEKSWKETDEASDTLSFDIGLAPLPDDPWSRGKCATKLLQYMASGIPAIASPVGVHTEIIKEGVNGFLAKDASEWQEKLQILINDFNLRKTLGTAARKTVEENYSVQVSAPKLVNIFNDILL